MPIQRVTRIDIVRRLKQTYDTRLPGFDVQTEGTPEEDIFIKSPVYGALGSLWDSLYNTSLKQTLEYPERLTTAELNDKLFQNFGFARKSAIKATGSVTFSATEMKEDILIPAGTTVTTNGGIQFETVGTYTMLVALANTYYSATTGYFSITIPVRAVTGGSDTNVKARAINQFVSRVSGIVKVENSSATSGGKEQESNTEYANRFIQDFRGKELTSHGGMLTAIDNPDNNFDNVLDKLLVVNGDDLMVRDNGLGGAIDIYILGTDLSTYSESILWTSTGIYFSENPVNSIISVQGETLTYSEWDGSSGDYILVKDTNSTRRGSHNAQDKLIFTSTGNIPYEGESLVVQYNYNSLITSIQDFFDLRTNSAPNTDILIKEAIEILCAITLTITKDSSYNMSTITTNIRSILSAYVNSLLLGDKLSRFNIVTQVEDNVDGVVNVNLNSVSITANGGTIDSLGDLNVSDNQYTRLNEDDSGTPLVTVVPSS